LSTPKKEKIPDTEDDLWKTFNLDGFTGPTLTEGGLTFNVDYSGSATAGTFGPPLTQHEQRIEQLLTDIWHNQATMIKWLEKIYTASKK